jgi:hypothetical protein
MADPISLLEGILTTLIAALITWWAANVAKGKNRAWIRKLARGIAALALLVVAVATYRVYLVPTAEPPSASEKPVAPTIGIKGPDPAASQGLNKSADSNRLETPATVQPCPFQFTGAGTAETVAIVSGLSQAEEDVLVAELNKELGWLAVSGGGDAFQQAYRGDPSQLRTCPEARRISMVALGVARVQYSTNEQLVSGLHQADFSLALREFRPSRDFSNEVRRVSSVGAGFSQIAAFSKAAVQAVGRLKPR